jgi:chromosome segregation ATPase
MDYEALKAKEEELKKKCTTLQQELDSYQHMVYDVQRKMKQLDYTQVRLDSSQENILRNILNYTKSIEFCKLKFCKDDASRYDRYDSNQTVHHNDSIINIQSLCDHETLIATLSDHAFEICCEVLGQPHGNGDSIYTWLLRK